MCLSTCTICGVSVLFFFFLPFDISNHRVPLLIATSRHLCFPRFFIIEKILIKGKVRRCTESSAFRNSISRASVKIKRYRRDFAIRFTFRRPPISSRVAFCLLLLETSF